MTAKTKPNILVIDDEESMLKTYKSILKNNYNPVLFGNAPAAIAALPSGNFALVLLDLMMPEMNGLTALPKIKEQDSSLEVIMITGVHDIKSAVRAIKLGAYDYITKPFEVEELLSIVAKALERRSLIRENLYLRQTLDKKGQYLDLIGRTEVMQKIFALIDKIAATDSNVLVTGESGTGKELVANAIHKKSGRANRPFIVLNCAAIPETLIESELFGHERGAFTGAQERQEGKFELADGGTIFLDEIGCLKPAMQSKLLRVLQDNIVERIGGKIPLQVDVRVVAATNLDLQSAIKKGDFREDLYYRLNVMRIHLPPLRERKEDIPLFLNYFIGKFNREFNKNLAGICPEAVRMLSEHDWPGNVRELQNLIERMVALADEKSELSVADLPLENASRNIVRRTLKEALDEFERRYIKNTLAEAGNNQTNAAKYLGIHRTTLLSKMKELGL